MDYWPDPDRERIIKDILNREKYRKLTDEELREKYRKLEEKNLVALLKKGQKKPPPDIPNQISLF